MDKPAIGVYDSFASMKAEEYRYWRSRPVHERMEATSELSRVAYARKEAVPEVPRLRRTIEVLPRPRRWQ